MTVSTTTASASYIGNGSGTLWPVPFVVDDPSHFKVYVTNRSVSPIVVTEIPSTDYDIVENNIKYPKGTNITPLSSTRTITIMRVVPVLLDVNILEQTGYYLEDLNNAHKYLTYMIQQINDTLARTVKTPIGSGVNPDSYLDTIQTAVTQAQASATVAQNATIDMPAVPFKEVFGIGGVNPFSVLQTHNGYLAKATVGVGGLTVNLPKMDTLTFPYLFAVKRVSASGTLTIMPASGDTIEGGSSLVMDTDNQTVIFVADDDSLLGTWTTVYAGAGGGSGTIGDGTITGSKLANNAVTNTKIADGAVTSGKIGAGAVTNTKIANGHVGYPHFDSYAKAIYDGVLFQDVLVFDDGGSPYTLDATYKGKMINIDATDGNLDIILPEISTISPPFAIVFRRSAGSGIVTFTRGGTTDTINGGTTFVLSVTVGNGVIFVADFTLSTIGTWSTLVVGGDATITDGSIDASKIANNAVTTAKILNGNVTTAKIANSAVTSTELANNAVTTAKIANDAVTVDKIADGSIFPAHIIPNAIETSHISDQAVNTQNIANGAVGLTQLSAVVNSLFDGMIGVGIQAYSNAGSPYTLSDAQRGNVLNVDASAGAVSITLPQISTSTSPYALIIKRSAGTSAITLNRSSTNTFNGAVNTSYTLSTTVGHAVLVVADFSGGTAGQWTTFVLGEPVGAGAITATELATNAVTSVKILDGNITQAKLATAVSDTLDNVTARDVISFTTTASLTASHRGNLVNLAGGTYTITLPQISTVTSPYSVIFRRSSSTGTITIARAGTDTINSGASTGLTTVTLSSTVGDWIEFIADFTGATANQWFTRS